MVKGKVVSEVKVSSFKPGLHCVGEICFSDDGFNIKVGRDASDECREAIADVILQGKKVRVELEGKEAEPEK